MTEFEHDGSALAAVRAFLARQEDSSSDDEEPPEKYIPRPARLGVGANPNRAVHGTTTPGLSEANRRLGNALRRQAQAAENSDGDNFESSDDDEVVSRAQAIGKSFQTIQDVEAKQTNEKESRHHAQNHRIEKTTAVKSKGMADSDSEDEWGDDVLRRVTEEQGAEFKRWSEGFVPAQNTNPNFSGNTNALNGEKKHITETVVKRKKKKKRSRQKNLRRDKRKRHELPEHLTEETLRAGRVRRSENGKPEFHGSHFEDSRKKSRSQPPNETVLSVGSR